MPIIQITWSPLLSLESSVIDQLEDSPGAYRLSYKSADGHYYVFYIGETEHMRTRLSEHLNDVNTNPCVTSFIKNLKCFFIYSLIPNKNLRQDVERTIFERYKPKCNTQIPTGNIIDINFN